MGLLTRLAAFRGAFPTLLFYLSNYNVAHGHIDGDFAHLLVFLSVAAFGAGRIPRLDAIVEQFGVGGKPLIEQYPWMRYLLE